MKRFIAISILFVCTISSHNPLCLSLYAQSDYKMAGPYEVVARDGQYRHTKGGSERDMRAAFDFAQKANLLKGSAEGKACADKAIEIANAYALVLQRFDGHDAPLCLIQAFDLVRAMTIMKEMFLPTHSLQLDSWRSMVRRAILPTIDQFEADSPYANGNWGAIVNRCRMACAILLEDSTLYQASIDYFLHANDNGSLPRYISETGQCQETGRDQGHVQLGLEALAQTCEMAWQQGDDLWGALDNRLLKGFEYTARYNLGYDVPFEQWTDCTGLYNDWTVPGSMGRGRLWDVYQSAYNHYVQVKGLQMPYTKKVLALQANAERKGKSRTVQAPGVKEETKLHQVFTYPAPMGAPLKHDYDVFVRPRSSEEWTHIDTYMARVNAPSPYPLTPSYMPQVQGTNHRVSEISYAFFDFSGDVFVKVVTKNRKFKKARIRPNYRGVIANVQNDSTAQFLLFQPENVSVEFAFADAATEDMFDISNNLLLFTSKPCQSVEVARKEANSQKRQFVYYEPGFYQEQDTIRIASNTTVYLAPGSYFTGTFAIDDAENVSIIGRGVARPARGYEGCHVYRSKNVLVDGLILNTCPVGGSDGVTLHDVRSISHPGWGDGLNVFASSNVFYDRVFCRNSDDCTTAYATRKGFEGSVHHVHMRNSTLWADVAHPIFIGIHGNSERMDSIVDLRYENIDILCQSEAQVDYQGCLAINCGDNNFVRDVVFDNIRIEQIHQGSLLQVKVGFNQKYCTAPGRGVNNVQFRNVRYNSPSTSIPPYLSVITGYNEQRRVSNVTFEGLKINGKLIYDDMPGKPRWYQTTDYVPIFVGSHVDNIVFKK